MKLALLFTITLLTFGCASSTGTTLKNYTGRSITDFISERHYYPDSSTDLPNGNKVYRMSIQREDIRLFAPPTFCRVWIETDAAGLIQHWRYENCD